MSEWKELFDIVVELAFREAGRAFLWMFLFGIVGVIVGIVLMFAIWRFVGRMGFFQEDAWGRWGMRILLVLLGFSLIPLLATNGGIYGIIVAAEKTVDEQQLVEKASEESFGLGIGTFWEQLRNPELEDSKEELALADPEELLDLAIVRNEIEGSQEAIYQALQDRFLRDHEETFGKLPGWLRGFVEKRVSNVLNNSDLGKLFEGIYSVMDHAEERKGSQMVSSGDLAWSLGAVYLKPEVDKVGKDFQMGVLVGAVVQVVILILGHLLVGGLVIYLAQLVARKASSPKGEAS